MPIRFLLQRRCYNGMGCVTLKRPDHISVCDYCIKQGRISLQITENSQRDHLFQHKHLPVRVMDSLMQFTFHFHR